MKLTNIKIEKWIDGSNDSANWIDEGDAVFKTA